MVDTSASALCQTVANSCFGETRTDTECVAIVWIGEFRETQTYADGKVSIVSLIFFDFFFFFAGCVLL